MIPETRDDEDPIEPHPSDSERVVEYVSIAHITYQLEWIDCHNARCHTCPHGPYWRAYYRDLTTGRLRSVYIGKKFRLTKRHVPSKRRARRSSRTSARS